jgi:hypothetical protein
LALAGNREAPDPIALGLAKELPDRFKSLMPRIQSGLFEHYAPYKESVDAGEETGSPCPSVASPEAVWPHVTPAHVLVDRLEGVPTVEIAFQVAWDVEHTLGARFQNWQFIELNGSVRRQ